MLDLSPRRSVLTFRDFVGGDSVNIVVIRQDESFSLSLLKGQQCSAIT